MSRVFDSKKKNPDQVIDKVVPFDDRDPNIPYPIRADDGHWYVDDSVGYHYDTQLLSICGNNKFWNKRYRALMSHFKSNSGTIKCTRFKEVAESKNVNKLKAVCNVAYLMKKTGEDA